MVKTSEGENIEDSGGSIKVRFGHQVEVRSRKRVRVRVRVREDGMVSCSAVISSSLSTP